MIGNWNCAKSENILQYLNLVEENIQRIFIFLVFLQPADSFSRLYPSRLK